MYRFFTTTIFILLLASSMFANFDAFNYQAVYRDNNGAIQANKTITIQIQIRVASASGNVVFKEEHNVQTNQFGLFNILIGKGTTLSGSFANILWNTAAFFLETLIKPQGAASFISLGASKLQSVPFANMAGNGIKSVGKESGSNKIFIETESGTKIQTPIVVFSTVTIDSDCVTTPRNFITLTLSSTSLLNFAPGNCVQLDLINSFIVNSIKARVKGYDSIQKRISLEKEDGSLFSVGCYKEYFVTPIICDSSVKKVFVDANGNLITTDNRGNQNFVVSLSGGGGGVGDKFKAPFAYTFSQNSVGKLDTATIQTGLAYTPGQEALVSFASGLVIAIYINAYNPVTGKIDFTTPIAKNEKFLEAKTTAGAGTINVGPKDNSLKSETSICFNTSNPFTLYSVGGSGRLATVGDCYELTGQNAAGDLRVVLAKVTADAFNNATFEILPNTGYPSGECVSNWELRKIPCPDGGGDKFKAPFPYTFSQNSVGKNDSATLQSGLAFTAGQQAIVTFASGLVITIFINSYDAVTGKLNFSTPITGNEKFLESKSSAGGGTLNIGPKDNTLKSESSICFNTSNPFTLYSLGGSGRLAEVGDCYELTGINATGDRRTLLAKVTVDGFNNATFEILPNTGYPVGECVSNWELRKIPCPQPSNPYPTAINQNGSNYSLVLSDQTSLTFSTSNSIVPNTIIYNPTPGGGQPRTLGTINFQDNNNNQFNVSVTDNSCSSCTSGNVPRLNSNNGGLTNSPIRAGNQSVGIGTNFRGGVVVSVDGSSTSSSAAAFESNGPVTCSFTQLDQNTNAV